jgi:hypothetical protein
MALSFNIFGKNLLGLYFPFFIVRILLLPLTYLVANYYLPKKFGYDKRRPHFSSLIVSGQLTREEALEKIKEPLYQPDELENDIVYFCKKLRITRNEFDKLIDQPNRYYTEFANWDSRHQFLKRTQKIIEKITGKQIKVYS